MLVPQYSQKAESSSTSCLQAKQRMTIFANNSGRSFDGVGIAAGAAMVTGDDITSGGSGAMVSTASLVRQFLQNFHSGCTGSSQLGHEKELTAILGSTSLLPQYSQNLRSGVNSRLQR